MKQSIKKRDLGKQPGRDLTQLQTPYLLNLGEKLKLDPELLHCGSGPSPATAEDLSSKYTQPDFADSPLANDSWCPWELCPCWGCGEAGACWSLPIDLLVELLQDLVNVRHNQVFGLITSCQTLWCSEEGAGRCLVPWFSQDWSLELFCLQLWVVLAIVKSQAKAGKA